MSPLSFQSLSRTRTKVISLRSILRSSLSSSVICIQPVIRHLSLTASITPRLDHALSAIQISSPFWSVSIIPLYSGTASYLHHTHTELAIQRIEAQSSLPLSRQIATPNIASKGKLLPRTVNIPSALLKDPISKKPLIQELPDDDAKPNPKGILKCSSPRPTPLPLEWSWSRLDSGTLSIVFRVPNMVGTRFYPISVISLTNTCQDTRSDSQNEPRC